MAVLTVTIQLPVRAALWVHAIASKEKTSVRKFLEGLVLRGLQTTPGVDLSRSPGDLLKGGSDGGLPQTLKGGRDVEEGNSGDSGNSAE